MNLKGYQFLTISAWIQKIPVTEYKYNIFWDTKQSKHELIDIFQGGFAKCYEVVEISSGEIYAAKVVSKSLLKKEHQKEKMSQEIRIHR